MNNYPDDGKKINPSALQGDFFMFVQDMIQLSSPFNFF